MTKGRDPQLIKARNAKLAARYYYYAELLGLRLEHCLDRLVPEFDLTRATIYDLITKHTALIARLQERGVGIGQLKQWYPYLNWPAHSLSKPSPRFAQPF